MPLKYVVVAQIYLMSIRMVPETRGERGSTPIYQVYGGVRPMWVGIFSQKICRHGYIFTIPHPARVENWQKVFILVPK